ncbi:ENTH domain-containing protein [Dipodascopsis uninucleata]
MPFSIVRSIKNHRSGYTNEQIKVRNVTNNDPFSPTEQELQEINQWTYDKDRFHAVFEILYMRLNDKSKYWRHIIKALIVLDYCLHLGSVDAQNWCKDKLYIIKTLREFEYVDELGNDLGINGKSNLFINMWYLLTSELYLVRSKARQLTELIQDSTSLRKEQFEWQLLKCERGNIDSSESSTTTAATAFTFGNATADIGNGNLTTTASIDPRKAHISPSSLRSAHCQVNVIFIIFR